MNTKAGSYQPRSIPPLCLANGQRAVQPWEAAKAWQLKLPWPKGTQPEAKPPLPPPSQRRQTSWRHPGK